MGETNEGFREVFISLWTVLINESIPEFHEPYLSGCAICEVIEGLNVRKNRRRDIGWAWGK
jgi:hypothetical protein